MGNPILEGLGLVGVFLVVYAVVLSFFLPFYVMGIYNQTKASNKNLKKLVELFQKHADRFELREQNPNTKSWEA